ncbi:MAG TPA: glycosyltransferase family 2 protein [Planctomycetota bacterium]|nr:glycosyltransferase family 2 protein [Planctomycetota bacterium]
MSAEPPPFVNEPPPRRIDKVVVVLPAYRAAKTLEATVAAVPADFRCEFLLVDDHSPDDTLATAQRLGIRAVRHERNLGYGGNQKTCYRLALEAGADVVVMLHPDYQYDPRVLPAMVEFLRLNICDVVLGSRIRSRREAVGCGMPVWKYLANRFLTIVENVVLGQNLGDFHTGYRAYAREVLERIPWQANSNDFVFDSQFLAQVAFFRFRMSDVPVPCRYFKEASSINFKRSARYGLLTLWTLVQFLLARLGIWRAPIFR